MQGIHTFDAVTKSAQIDYYAGPVLVGSALLTPEPEWHIVIAASGSGTVPMASIQGRYDATLRWVEIIRNWFGPPQLPQLAYTFDIAKGVGIIEVKFKLEGTRLLGLRWNSGDPDNVQIAPAPAIDITWADYRVYGRAWAEFMRIYEEVIAV